MGKQLGQHRTTFECARANMPAQTDDKKITVDIKALKSHMHDVVGAVIAVHDELGPGVNEYCYQEALEIELTARGIPFKREMTFHPLYKGVELKANYRVDFICKDDIVVECKAVEALTPTLRSQLFNYMRLLKASCGLIVNFSPKFADLERYFYDVSSRTVLTVSGVPVK